MKFAPHTLSALGAVGLIIAGCVEADPTVSSDGAAADAAPLDAPTSAVVDPAASQAGVGPAEPSDCNAAAAERFVGQKADSPLRARLLDAVAPVTMVRWVGPGDATTEDYSPSRLNVMLDAGGAIRSAHCG